MLLMVEKGIRGRICHAMHRCAVANSKYMENRTKIMNCHIICNLMQAIYIGNVSKIICRWF